MSRRKGHYLSFRFTDSHVVCPDCGYVRRLPWHKPLIHKGRKPR